ncbi:705_t:CDS:2, partial [Scutellospora calospora]
YQMELQYEQQEVNTNITETSRERETLEETTMRLEKRRIAAAQRRENQSTSYGVNRHTLGDMIYECSKCKAKMWLDEKKENSSAKSLSFTTCCAEGKVLLPPLQELLPLLDLLLTETDQRACLFQQNIRIYNSALAFTSIDANIDHSVTETQGIYTFRIHGEVYHSIGALLPNSDIYPQFAQIYIYDTNNKLQNRMNIIPDLDHTILAELQQMLHDANPYAKIFCQASDMLVSDFSLDLKIIIKEGRTTDSQHYNTLSAAEVAIIMVGNGQEVEPVECDIQSVNDELSFSNEEEEDIGKYVSAMNYFAYRLQLRNPRELIILHQFGRLFQQWIVDMYAVVEQTRLNYLKFNQKKICAELYSELEDA